MEYIALLRGVTPVGQNRIPDMGYLAQCLTLAGFRNVRTYLQSGNIRLETTAPPSETGKLIHDTVREKIGADLQVILKTKTQLETAAAENPFHTGYDASRVHLTFTNDHPAPELVRELSEIRFEGEIFMPGTECFYLYLPRDAVKKKLYTGFLEKRLEIAATTRKLGVVRRLCTL